VAARRQAGARLKLLEVAAFTVVRRGLLRRLLLVVVVVVKVVARVGPAAA